MEFIDNKDEFVFIPRNKSNKKVNPHLENIEIRDVNSDSLSAKKKKNEYLPPIDGLIRGVNILNNEIKAHKLIKTNDNNNINLMQSSTYYDYINYETINNSMPFDLSNSNSIKVTNNLIKIDHISINIENVEALRWKEPGGGLKDMTYSFELKLISGEYIEYKCTAKDGNGYWFGELKHLYKDSFSDIWPKLIHRIQKQTIANITIPIIALIEFDKEYIFGSMASASKKSSASLTINKKGVFMEVDVLFGKKTILVPWYQLSYKTSIGGIRIYHKLRIAENKYLLNSSFNVFALPVLIDTMKKAID